MHSHENNGGQAGGLVWTFDQRHDNWGTLLNFRIHRSGECGPLETLPPFEPQTHREQFEGNPNDFYCSFCRRRYVLLEVEDPRLANELRKRKTEGVKAIDPFLVSEGVVGCDCMSGHEHVLRHCEPAVAEGFRPGFLRVPLRQLTVADLKAEREASSKSMYGDSVSEVNAAQTPPQARPVKAGQPSPSPALPVPQPSQPTYVSPYLEEQP